MSAKTKKEVFESLATDLQKRLKDPMPVLLARLHRLDHVSHRKQHLEQVISAADAVLSRLKPNDIAQALGRKTTKPASAGKQRDILIDTLYRKGRALGYMELPEVIAKRPIADRRKHDRQFEQNFSQLGRWVETKSAKYFLLHVRRERRKGRFGSALQTLTAQMKNAVPNYWHYKKRLDLFRDLGWHHLAAYEETWKLLRFTDPPQ